MSEKLPKLIRILPANRVEIDGQEFPWYITEDGATVNVGSRRELTTVTLTIPCDRVEVDDQLSPDPFNDIHRAVDEIRAGRKSYVASAPRRQVAKLGLG